MLTEKPKVGQCVIALTNEYSDGLQYQTKDKVYRIVERHNISDNPCFIDDLGKRSYVDEEVLDLYNLYVEAEKRKVVIDITGLEVWAKDYKEEATDFSLHMKVIANPKELLVVLDELEKDIEQLIKEKYQTK